MYMPATEERKGETMSEKAEVIEVRGRRYRLHEACALFPEIPARELIELADDIKANGQREPIVMLPGDVILDGRNRMKACAIAASVPITRLWAGECGSPARYAASVNMRRRSLTDSQRAAIGAELLPMFEAEAAERKKATQAKPKAEKPEDSPVSDSQSLTGGRVRPEPQAEPTRKAADDAADAVGVSSRQVERAKALKASDPAKFEEVKAGTKTVHAAAKEVKEAKAPRGVEVGEPIAAFRAFAKTLRAFNGACRTHMLATANGPNEKMLEQAIRAGEAKGLLGDAKMWATTVHVAATLAAKADAIAHVVASEESTKERSRAAVKAKSAAKREKPAKKPKGKPAAQWKRK